MKLYFAPGACSMAPHIVLREAGYTFDLEKVDLTKKQTASGEDYTQINPKGYVPALRLSNGEVLTEAAVTLQYLADQKPESRLAPKMGTMERYRLMEWLNFTSSEIHKQFGPLFNPKITQEWKENQLDLLSRRFDYLTERLKRRDRRAEGGVEEPAIAGRRPGEAGDASRRKVIVGAVLHRAVVQRCGRRTNRGVITCRVMRVHFGVTMAEMHHEHSDTPTEIEGQALQAQP